MGNTKPLQPKHPAADIPTFQGDFLLMNQTINGTPRIEAVLSPHASNVEARSETKKFLA